jgi:SAM-dependent methyltransferase
MVNQAERRRWNDDRWTGSWPNREQLTSAVTPVLLGAAAARQGERLLDVGSGGGHLSLELASRVGPTGHIVGADLSEALVDLARQRAESTGTDNVSFVVADAQTDELALGPFDGAVSQFGLMFFDDPVRAFANVRRHLRSGGRLVFACWQAVERNPWHTGRTLAPFVTPIPEAPPGTFVPGPFSLGDQSRTAAILAQAGFVDASHRDAELVVRASANAVGDPGLFGFMGVPPEEMERARSALDRHLAQFQRGLDTYEFPLAFSIWQARTD